MFDSVSSVSAKSSRRVVDWRMKVLVLFGTRPEVIKLAPVIHELRRNSSRLSSHPASISIS
jgi:hypothetical protein